MSRPPNPARRRSAALVAAAVAAIMLAAVLAVWLGSDAAADRALFGATGSVAVIAADLVAVLAGAVLIYRSPTLPAAARWSIALVLALLNGVIGCLALVLVITPEETVDVGVGMMLAVAVFTTNIVAGQVARAPVTADPA